MNWVHASTAALNAASKAHRRWSIPTDAWIDVFGVAAKQGVFLAFRPLGNLGAAVITEPGAGSGIIVNSKHPLSRQRYSVAHELGHLFFKHPSVVDMADIFETGAAAKTGEEKLAESFASWFLMPPGLIDEYAARRGIERIATPEQVYDLSLFLGTSYESTANHLRYSKRASQQRAQAWLKVHPRDIKRERLNGRFELDNPWSDVHLLTEVDDGAPRLVRSGDRIIVSLHEIPSSGYRWRLEPNAAFGVLFDDYDAANGIEGADVIVTGALRKRKFVISTKEVDERIDVPLVFEQLRVWQPHEPARRFASHVTIESMRRLGFPPRYLEAAA